MCEAESIRSWNLSITETPPVVMSALCPFGNPLLSPLPWQSGRFVARGDPRSLLSQKRKSDSDRGGSAFRNDVVLAGHLRAQQTSAQLDLRTLANCDYYYFAPATVSSNNSSQLPLITGPRHELLRCSIEHKFTKVIETANFIFIYQPVSDDERESRRIAAVKTHSENYTDARFSVARGLSLVITQIVALSYAFIEWISVTAVE
ncbi:hypothetical protein ANO11243_075810 [Dothideomycetidae sp. 11243]|nr:hypothetical protein ANO11243_075810 [fungal sp. No.11243]